MLENYLLKKYIKIIIEAPQTGGSTLGNVKSQSEDLVKYYDSIRRLQKLYRTKKRKIVKNRPLRKKVSQEILDLSASSFDNTSYEYENVLKNLIKTMNSLKKRKKESSKAYKFIRDSISDIKNLIIDYRKVEKLNQEYTKKVNNHNNLMTKIVSNMDKGNSDPSKTWKYVDKLNKEFLGIDKNKNMSLEEHYEALADHGNKFILDTLKKYLKKYCENKNIDSLEDFSEESLIDNIFSKYSLKYYGTPDIEDGPGIDKLLFNN
tara:strand:- start:386 stop:1171 length:786 start_codon:yes stop_codon:yes gene_type:complete